MRKFILLSLFAVLGASAPAVSFAQDNKAAVENEAAAEIKFEKLTHDFGKFKASSPVVNCVFKFTNVGQSPLVINQVVASCGCTSPSYTKEPVAPGASGEIKVTYNGEGKFPGPFKKTITVRTNGKIEMTRLHIQGDMEEN